MPDWKALFPLHTIFFFFALAKIFLIQKVIYQTSLIHVSDVQITCFKLAKFFKIRLLKMLLAGTLENIDSSICHSELNSENQDLCK